jgi:hypothetical protein
MDIERARNARWDKWAIIGAIIGAMEGGEAGKKTREEEM